MRWMFFVLYGFKAWGLGFGLGFRVSNSDTSPQCASSLPAAAAARGAGLASQTEKEKHKQATNERINKHCTKPGSKTCARKTTNPTHSCSDQDVHASVRSCRIRAFAMGCQFATLDAWIRWPACCVAHPLRPHLPRDICRQSRNFAPKALVAQCFSFLFDTVPCVFPPPPPPSPLIVLFFTLAGLASQSGLPRLEVWLAWPRSRDCLDSKAGPPWPLRKARRNRHR